PRPQPRRGRGVALSGRERRAGPELLEPLPRLVDLPAEPLLPRRLRDSPEELAGRGELAAPGARLGGAGEVLGARRLGAERRLVEARGGRELAHARVDA